MIWDTVKAFFEAGLKGVREVREANGRFGSWKNIEEVEYATLEWVDWFNNKRLLESIGNVLPAELEQAYYEQLESRPKAA